MKLSFYIKNYFIINTILIVCAFSCTKNSNSKTDNGDVIAKINNSILYTTDISNNIPEGISKTDSITFTKSLINKWASDEVFYNQALIYLSDEEKDIEKEIEAYKKELITHKFQIKLINDKLDTVISNEQIEEYYNTHSQNFLLKNNIVKVLYVKTPINIPNLDKLKKLCYSANDPKETEQLKTLCIQYANNYYMNDNTWLMFDDLKKEIYQLKGIPDYSIESGKIFEFNDAKSFYFLKIVDVKSKNTLSPINFEKNNIKNMLINQRKQKLINSIKKDFFEKAKANKELEIYN